MLEKEYVEIVAREALNTIMSTIDRATFWSWGVSKVGYAEYKGMPSLTLYVSGLLHTGKVIVSLNEGADLYEVRLVKKNKVIKTITDVYFDQLGYVIDANVERDPSINEDEYYKMAMADSEIKCNAK